MAYNEDLAQRVRETLVHLENAEEKEMFGGLCFMVNEKMCMGIVKDELMCRIDPALEQEALAHHGCRPMDFTGRPMKGYLFVEQSALRSRRDLQYWVDLCLEFNERAKSSKRKK